MAAGGIGSRFCMGWQRQIEYDDGGRSYAAKVQPEIEVKSEKKTVHKSFFEENKNSEIFDILFNSLGLATNI